MSTILDSLRDTLRSQLDARAAIETDIDNIIAGAEQRGDGGLTAEESAAFTEKRQQTIKLDEKIAEARASVQQFEEREAARQAADDLARSLPTSTEKTVGGAVVRNEARTYRPDVQHGFLSDLYAMTFRHGDFQSAEQRMARHQREVDVERRDIVTSAVAGVVPPQYLVDQFAPVARAGRPFLNSLNALPLPPDGVSFFIPRGTTGSAAAMTAEGAGFNEQDMANTDVALTVNLVTAQQDISRTLFMRGGPLVDSIIFGDLVAASEVALNTSAINGNGTAPQHRGVLQVAGISSVAYTDASPTVPELWPKLSDAIQRINSLRFMPGNVIYMHPRRWGMITSATDTTGRPLFEFSTTPPNVVMGLGRSADYGQIVGTLQGLPVITDATIPTNLGAGTNEDIIIVARSFDFLYWEDDVMQFTFEQTLSTAPGQVRLAAGRFSLFTAGRYPTSISTIGGTGLVPPAF